MHTLQLENPHKLSPTQEIFTQIYRQNGWGKHESKSGYGSTLENTQRVRNGLPLLLKCLKVKNIVDIPCGDFNWMKEVDLEGYEYVGGDIVEEMVQDNQAAHGGDYVRFIHIDGLSDPLPTADILISRDLLVHFSYEDIFRYLRNVKRSGTPYFLTTHFIKTEENRDIVTGGWRPLNLNAAPFHFPKSYLDILENVSLEPQYEGSKSLSLFRVSELPDW